MKANEKKKFVVPVTWVMAGEVVVEAKNELEANDLANAMTLDKFENVAPVNHSLDIDFDMIEEVPTPEDTQAAKSSLQGADVVVVAGGLSGAAGEVIEMTTSTQGEPAVVIFLKKDADKQVMGKAGDEVIALASDVEVDMIEEVPTPADTQAAVEDYVFWREAIEGVK